jgi:hypothetical protein
LPLHIPVQKEPEESSEEPLIQHSEAAEVAAPLAGALDPKSPDLHPEEGQDTLSERLPLDASNVPAEVEAEAENALHLETRDSQEIDTSATIGGLTPGLDLQ